jgi:hypothetical protein
MLRVVDIAAMKYCSIQIRLSRYVVELLYIVSTSQRMNKVTKV